MKKIIYTLGGILNIVIPSKKSDIEKVIGPLSQEEYEAHVMERSIPDGAVNVRSINDNDIPNSRVFRDAWCDVTPETSIDIDCSKAKDVVLNAVRAKRADKFKPLDDQFMLALENGEDTSKIKAEKQKLRDLTNPIKLIKTENKFNDEAILAALLEHMNIEQ